MLLWSTCEIEIAPIWYDFVTPTWSAVSLTISMWFVLSFHIIFAVIPYEYSNDNETDNPQSHSFLFYEVWINLKLSPTLECRHSSVLWRLHRPTSHVCLCSKHQTCTLPSAISTVMQSSKNVLCIWCNSRKSWSYSAHAEQYNACSWCGDDQWVNQLRQQHVSALWLASTDGFTGIHCSYNSLAPWVTWW